MQTVGGSLSTLRLDWRSIVDCYLKPFALFSLPPNSHLMQACLLRLGALSRFCLLLRLMRCSASRMTWSTRNRRVCTKRSMHSTVYAVCSSRKTWAKQTLRLLILDSPRSKCVCLVYNLILFFGRFHNNFLGTTSLRIRVTESL